MEVNAAMVIITYVSRVDCEAGLDERTSHYILFPIFSFLGVFPMQDKNYLKYFQTQRFSDKLMHDWLHEGRISYRKCQANLFRDRKENLAGEGALLICQCDDLGCDTYAPLFL